MDRFDSKRPRVLAFDCEATDLYGPCFAVGAVLIGEDWRTPLATLGLRCPPPCEPSAWVRERVFPAVEHLPICRDARDMRDEFWAFFTRHREGAIVVADVAWPVETDFLTRTINDQGQVSYNQGRAKLAPHPLYDLATILGALGIDPDTDREEFLKGDLVAMGGKHNPVYDAALTGIVTLRIMLDRPRWNPLTE